MKVEITGLEGVLVPFMLTEICCDKVCVELIKGELLVAADMVLTPPEAPG